MPGPPPFYLRPHFGYLTRYVHTGDVGQLNGADPWPADSLASEYVEAVESARPHPHYHIVRRFHGRSWHLLDPHLLGSSVFPYDRGPHRVSAGHRHPSTVPRHLRARGVAGAGVGGSLMRR